MHTPGTPSSPENRGPWEFRITKFPSVAVRTSTGTDRYNFFNIEGEKLTTGFHGASESFENDIGEVFETTPGSLILVPKGDLKKGVLETVIPAIVAKMREQGKTVQIVEAADESAEMAA